MGRVPPEAAARARAYAERGEAHFGEGRAEQGLALATRALVVRIAACGPDCPEVAVSFVQLGDMRWRLGQRSWAAQSYRRAFEILSVKPDAHRAWLRAIEGRLALACAPPRQAPTPCRAP